MLTNGDLVVGSSGYGTVTGGVKIRQELALMVGEEHGADRFHPDLGSTLIQFIGQPITEETRRLVQAELGRVVQQYILIQQREVLQDHLAQRASRFDASDVVVGLTGVTAVVGFSSIAVRASLMTRSGEQISISRTVTN